MAAELIFMADKCTTCNGSGGKHRRFFTSDTDTLVPVGDCDDCDGDGWIFADDTCQFRGTYEQCSIWARTEALKPTAPPPVLEGVA